VLEDPKYYRVAHGLGVAPFGNLCTAPSRRVVIAGRWPLKIEKENWNKVLTGTTQSPEVLRQASTSKHHPSPVYRTQLVHLPTRLEAPPHYSDSTRLVPATPQGDHDTSYPPTQHYAALLVPPKYVPLFSRLPVRMARGWGRGLCQSSLQGQGVQHRVFVW